MRFANKSLSKALQFHSHLVKLWKIFNQNLIFFSIQQTKSIKKHFGALKQQIPSTGVPVNPKPTSFSWSDKINGKLKKAKPKKKFIK